MRTTLLALALVLVVLPARALTQPNGITIPTGPGCTGGTQVTGLLATFACICTQPGVCNIGAPCTSPNNCDDGQHGTCESTMWHSFNDNTCIPSNHSGLDPVAEASTMPETFHPTCALTFTVVTRGQAIFQNVFGWYNVTGQPPALTDLHPMLNCGDGPGTKAVLDIQNEPAYTGGDVAFFLLTPESHTQHGQCSGGNCCPTIARAQAGEGYVYYSQRAFNPDQAGASSFIHLLVYNSHLEKRKFYFAWEDIFGGSDDEFTDLVTSVEGVECSGGGQMCNTGMPGACSLGVGECQMGQISCTPVVMPQPEVCNGVDDNCDGLVDNGATCSDPAKVCDNGSCVPKCGSSEFRCPTGSQCDNASGLCVDPACVGVTCSSMQVCRNGQCVSSCQGVTCPHGQSCVNNACIDPCAGVSCGSGQVCREGVCFAGCGQCDGVVCDTGQTCDTSSGQCGDMSCPNGCAAGTFCQAGSCVDDCQGAMCPSGQTCTAGQCVPPSGGGGPDGGLAPTGAGVDGGGGSVEAGAAPGDSLYGSQAPHGCSCRQAAPSSNEGAAACALLASGALFIRLRARRKRRT